MYAYLELWRPEGVTKVALEGDQLTIGRQPDNELALANDEMVSGQHAVLSRYPAGWCVRDLSSRNGTFVNGRRLLSEHPLWHGDELRVGTQRLVYRAPATIGRPRVPTGATTPPDLTKREVDVLLALCCPLLDGDSFTEPASVREVAAELEVSDAAIKQHLAQLYVKFELPGGVKLRVRLANAAVRSGAVTLEQLRKSRGEQEGPGR